MKDNTEQIHTDVVIVGGGSAGVGAAYRLSRAVCPIRVVVIEKNPGLGGVSVFGGVNCWEPGIGGSGVHTEISAQLLAQADAACVGRQEVFPDGEIRWGMSRPSASGYQSTLRRAGLRGVNLRRFQFEPAQMEWAMRCLFSQTPQVKFLFESELCAAEVENGAIRSVCARLRDGREMRITASVFLDCSGDIALARLSGCRTRRGEESRSVFDEPSAPECGSPEQVNGMTMVFRVGDEDTGLEQELACQAESTDVSGWFREWVVSGRLLSQINEYPNAEWNVNMLPTMDGAEYFRLGALQAEAVCRARVWRYWRWLQQREPFAGKHIKMIFPMPGIRESWRLDGEYVLKEQDVRAGLSHQPLADHVVALADHALDTHGRTNIKGPRCPELRQPYGIPYECMLPREIDNLLVACRGCSMSHIAASSARLSRTMLALGEAAGEAAALCLAQRAVFRQLSVQMLREQLGMDAFERKLVAEYAISETEGV